MLCDMAESIFFVREALLSDVTNIAWVFAGLEIKCLISHQHFTAL